MPQPTTQPLPLAQPDTWDLVAASYAAEVVPLFETYAREALRLAGVTAGMRVVDVAAGPGTLSLLAARAGASVSAIDFAPAMVEQARSRVEQAGLRGVEVSLGDGMALPFADASFDAGFSMFGLMFFPDRARGFRELSRVLKPGARAVVSSWVPMDRLPIFATFFEALAELVPGPAPAGGLPLTDPHVFEAEMTAGGFVDFAVREVAVTEDAPSMAELLASMVRTSAPIALHRRRLGDKWPSVENQLLARLVDRLGPGPQRLVMTANLAVGTRAP